MGLAHSTSFPLFSFFPSPSPFLSLSFLPFPPCREAVPEFSYRGYGERCKLPRRGPGGAPAQKHFYYRATANAYARSCCRRLSVRPSVRLSVCQMREL